MNLQSLQCAATSLTTRPSRFTNAKNENSQIILKMIINNTFYLNSLLQRDTKKMLVERLNEYKDQLGKGFTGILNLCKQKTGHKPCLRDKDL